MKHELDGAIVFDSESDGFVYEATKLHVISMCGKDKGDEVQSYTSGADFDRVHIEAGLERLSQAPVIIGHNIIKHDIPLFKKLYPGWEHKLVLDTLVLSALLYPDRVGGHSIEAWGRRMGGEQKVAHEDWSVLTEDMILRCESDTRLNVRVLWRLLKEAYAPISGVDIYNFDFGEYNHV